MRGNLSNTDDLVPLSPWSCFRHVGVRAYGSRGTPYLKQVPTNVPQLGDYNWLLDTVFFLYDDREKAERGAPTGATGFLVMVPSELNAGRGYVYGVTNWHVACRGTSVVRINRPDSAPEIFDFGPEDWSFVPNSYDVAVVSLPVRRAIHKVSYIPTSLFLTPDVQREQEIGVADDVIHWGQFPEKWPVGAKISADEMAEPETMLGANSQYVRGMSGMTCVAPAAAILEALDLPKLREHRATQDPIVAQYISQEGAPVEEREPSAKADNPSHKEDFKRLLGAATAKRQSDDQT